MRYVLYIFTLTLVFLGGMLVGHVYLPDSSASLAGTVTVPELSRLNPAIAAATDEQTRHNLDILSSAFAACPLVVNDEKDRLLNQIRLYLALKDFELKKTKLELEMAKNNQINRPTGEFTQATVAYTQARDSAEKLADELFPLPPQPAEDPTIVNP